MSLNGGFKMLKNDLKNRKFKSRRCLKMLSTWNNHSDLRSNLCKKKAH